jgi:hypothetical protein
MNAHEHDDPNELVIGCRACIDVARMDQLLAEVDAAPLRRCRWTCKYFIGADTHRLTFDRDVRVPTGWDGWRVDDYYAGLTGEAFVMALPESVTIHDTDKAVETMEVVSVTIGAIVPDAATADKQPSLFGEPT